MCGGGVVVEHKSTKLSPFCLFLWKNGGLIGVSGWLVGWLVGDGGGEVYFFLHLLHIMTVWQCITWLDER